MPLDERGGGEAARNNVWLNKRFESVRTKRLASTRATTVKLASIPYRFGEVRQTGNESVMIVPSVSSETREYLPVGYSSPGTIISNLAFGLFDAPLWNMAIIASRLHLIWIATVCGKMKTDFRYSNTLGWNTFPVPTLTEKNKTDLTRCAEDILLAREHHFPATVADYTNPTPCRRICARRTSATTKCLSAFISGAVLRTTPSGWKNCSTFIRK